MEASSRIRDVERHLRIVLKNLALDCKFYGLYSLRSGGLPPLLVTNLSERHCLLLLHGRWKSDCAKDIYVLEDVSKRLGITANLGLLLL